MADLSIRTEAEAKKSILKVTRSYLETHHANELALFLPALEPYLDLDLEDFDNPEKKPQTDHMLGELAVNYADIAIRVLGSVCIQLLQGRLVYRGQMVYGLIKQRVFHLSQDALLAEQMATFFLKKFENKDL